MKQKTAQPKKTYKPRGRRLYKRLVNYNYANDRPAHIAVCTKNRKAAFDSAIKAEIVIAELLNAVKGLKFKMLCYCLMPDHLHLVVSPANSGASLAMFLNFFKTRTAEIFKKRFEVNALWQKSAFDRVIRKDGDLKTAIEHILNNPVRKGMTETADDYPHSRLFGDIVKEYL